MCLDSPDVPRHLTGILIFAHESALRFVGKLDSIMQT